MLTPQLRRDHAHVYLLAIFCWSLLLVGHTDATQGRFPFQPGRHIFGWKGSFFPNRVSEQTKNDTVEEYVAAMKEKDGHTPIDEPSSCKKESGQEADEVETVDNDDNDPQTTAEATKPDGEDPAVVGVKSHTQKKSNAVGDPDGDDDDDSDDTELDDSEEWEELAEAKEDFVEDDQVHVQMELVEESTEGENEEEGSSLPSTTGGGVGLRLGQALGRRKDRRPKNGVQSSSAESPKLSLDQQRLLDAWSPHIFFPPTPSALKHLSENARLIDANSRNRLDRRTLYAGLLLEFGAAESKLSASNRKFLPPKTAQALQAALSMATQPQWRKSAPRTSGIRLYPEEEDSQWPTLAMQETVVMALAHSLGCGVLILDDDTVSAVMHKLSPFASSEDTTKPAALLESLLTIASEGNIRPRKRTGSIEASMRRDLSQGLDDPYDERATMSCDEMNTWEKEWENVDRDDGGDDDAPLPLLIFVRTRSSQSLLKSQSAMKLLIQQCTSENSIHLIALGKGIDSKTESLPKEPTPQEPHEYQEDSSGRGSPSQNASGQFDPAGSRRFNIFLARTLDNKGQPGILGAIAPSQAGNLFPHMMSMQARERMQGQDKGSPPNIDLERWNQMMQNQLNNNGGPPMLPPQFFNASLAYAGPPPKEGQQPPQPPPEVIEMVLQQAMSELLDNLADMSEEEDESPPSSSGLPNVNKAFAQVLRNEKLRQGIAENLAKAAPALSDPKCQGVMLTVYVPPSPQQLGQGALPGNQEGRPGNMSGWFQNLLNNQNVSDAEQNDDEEKKKRGEKRVRTMAAAAAVVAANKASNKSKQSSDSKATRNLSKLESLCRPIDLAPPEDPVRLKSWEAWVSREKGSVIFRQNRGALNSEFSEHKLTLHERTGTRGAGSALRQMLSVRDVTEEMVEVIRCAVELEAAKSLRRHGPPEATQDSEVNLDVDHSLSQLWVPDRDVPKADAEAAEVNTKGGLQYLHPSSLEAALSRTCSLSSSPTGGLPVSSPSSSHRSKEEIAALAHEKHERALISQVISPQDIGVTYDMIGGLSDVKELLRQSITYPLKFPHLYSEGIAREAVKGVLLFGPPGTGKTMLAKAVATEGGASFLSVDASSVENKWLGESEKNAKAVFTLARRLAPCVVFVDEVDSLLSSREGSADDSAHGTLTSVKTTMMSEWDGLNSGTNGSGDRVIVIGSTNRPFDLDEAVLRRFPRRILVDLPDLETRKEILEVTLAENRVDTSVNLTQIAERLEGYTGSDIKEVCREAVVQISHEQARLLDQGMQRGNEDLTEGSLQRLRPVTMDDFETAMSKLKRSVSEKGRELARVWEWNDEYGEVKRKETNRLPHLMNMYL